MKSKQPIYIFTKSDFHRRCYWCVPHDSWVYGPYFGTIRSAAEYQNMIDEIVFDENGCCLVSKAMEVINKRLCNKLSPPMHSDIRKRNGALLFLKYDINRIRKPKDV